MPHEAKDRATSRASAGVGSRPVDALSKSNSSIESSDDIEVDVLTERTPLAANGLIASDQPESVRLAELMMQAPAFIAVLGGKDHVFEFVNKAYYQLVGHRDITGKPVLTAIPEVRGQGYMELLDGVYETGQEFVGNEMALMLQREPNAPLEQRLVNFVYQAIRNARGDVIGIFVHGVDVTDFVLARQKSEQLATQVAQQARTFDAVLSSIQDFVYTFDASGRFTYANAPLIDLLGTTLADMVGKTFHDLPYPKELADTLQTHIAHVFATGDSIRDETPYTNPLGHLGYYEYIFVPIFGSDGAVELVAGSTRDITHFKRLEQQKDEFIAVASHELRTPVTSIKAYAQILERRFTKESNPQAAELVAKMDMQIDRLARLVDDLLDVTKIDAGKLQLHNEWFEVGGLVVEIVEQMQMTTTRHQVHVNATSSVKLFADRDRVGQVVINLLSNAIKYSPAADSIVVDLSVREADVVISVKDFGVGLSPESRERVFERFYRVADSTSGISGLGLGLFISAEIVGRLGGRIWVEPNRGPGSTFCLSLPLPAASELTDSELR